MSRFDSLYSLLEGGSRLMNAISACKLSINEISLMLERGRIEDERINSGRNLKPRKAEAESLELWLGVNSAQALAKVNMELAINRAAMDGEWRAAAWVLEKRYPAEYGSLAETKKQMDELITALKAVEK